MAGPAYYCPPGVSLPSHAASVAPIRTDETGSPDGLPGLCYGRAYDPSDEWTKTSAGWWIQWDRAPRSLLRRNAVRGTTVAGWIVPQVLDLDGLPVVGFFGPAGFTVPAPWDGLADRLRAEADYSGPMESRHATLAADLLAANYHASLEELALVGLLTRDVVAAILCAASGVSPDQAARLAIG